MSVTNLGRHVVLLFFTITILVYPCCPLHAAENRKFIEDEQGMACCGPEDYTEITPGLLPVFWEREAGTFDLAQYYDDLDPPGQDGLLGRYSILAEDALYFTVPALLVLGTLYLLPEDVSNWDKDKINWEHGIENWTENVTSWQWDEDDAWINYIGHPYFGSAYYVYARHYGYSRMESFWFSFSVSAFYEIGLEAWAEPVSIQDMIFTPLLGWGLAELLLPLEYKIQKNDKKVLNSRTLGAISLFLIDPFGHIVIPFKKWAQSVFSDDAEVTLCPLVGYNNLFSSGKTNIPAQHYGLVLTIEW
ncbi:MAG: DUF3943 domain-containing protein [Thermodesulfobacteriota bacterium]|nr:DUF3943 domain-containing protein [Thermodesulfobacteriota bacterium]